MNVLSLFDGISCGQVALQRAGIKVDNYYASEVDKYAMQVTMKNYPNTIQLGDVRNVNGSELPVIDLLMGGSPCQGFSFAGKQLNFEDERSKLFFEFVRLLEEVKPKYFLLENVKMKKEYQDIISQYLGVEPIEINSALVSAQNRVRLYWTNIKGIKQPEDMGFTIYDIIDKEIEDCCDHELFDFEMYNPIETINYIQFDISGKGYKSQQDRAYKLNKKFCCFPSARAITKRKILMGDTNTICRDLSLNECERIQTLPINYTALDSGFSLSKSLSAIGNGWTVDVITHIFSFI